MSKHMGSDRLLFQGRTVLLRALRVARDEFFDRVATERLTAKARKHAITLRGQIPSQPGLQDGGRVAAERGAALFPSLALAPHVRPTAQDDVRTPEADQFRDAQTRLDGDGQQGPVATADPRREIGGGEDGRDLRGVEKRDGLTLVAFAGHREDLLTQQGVRRFGERDVAKERVNRGQTRIAGSTTVAAPLLEVLEKPPDERGLDLLRFQHRGRLAQLVGGEAEEQTKRVAVAGDRMRARLPLSEQAVGEEALEERRETRGDHGATSAGGSVRRSADSWSSSGTASRYQYVSAVCT